MDRSYAAHYRELFDRHWWWRAREYAIGQELRRLLSRGSSARILDVGCGDGLLFDMLEQFGYVEGVEPNGSVLSPDSRYQRRIHVGPFDGSFEQDKTYDLVLMFDV